MLGLSRGCQHSILSITPLPLRLFIKANVIIIAKKFYLTMLEAGMEIQNSRQFSVADERPAVVVVVGAAVDQVDLETLPMELLCASLFLTWVEVRLLVGLGFRNTCGRELV